MSCQLFPVIYIMIFLFLFHSIQGLMAYKFTKPGTYYFSDQNHEFSATFMGTIIVKSKPKEHILEVNAQTGFSNGNSRYFIYIYIKNRIYIFSVFEFWERNTSDSFKVKLVCIFY